MKIEVDSIVERSPDQVSCDLAGESAILGLKNQTYYGLNEVGTRIWELLETPRTVGQIQGVLLQEFDVDAQQCGRDLLRLLQQLAKEQLIQVNSQ